MGRKAEREAYKVAGSQAFGHPACSQSRMQSLGQLIRVGKGRTERQKVYLERRTQMQEQYRQTFRQSRF